MVLRQLGSQPRYFPKCFCSHVPSCSSPRQHVSHKSLASSLCSTFLTWFLTSNCDSGFDGIWGPQVSAVGSEALIFSELSQQPGASYKFHVNFTLIASGICPKPVPAMVLESIWVPDEMQLTTTPQGSPSGATLFPYSAFSWVTFSGGVPQPCSSCGAPLIGVSSLDIFRIVSAPTCPAAALHVNLCPKHSLASGLRSTFLPKLLTSL